MSAKLDELVARKALVVSRLRIERMQVALYAGELRDAVRPASLIGSAIVSPSAPAAAGLAIALLFGWKRLAYWMRVASIGFAVFGIARKWRRPATGA
jgi:hypothetical protein